MASTQPSTQLSTQDLISRLVINTVGAAPDTRAAVTSAEKKKKYKLFAIVGLIGLITAAMVYIITRKQQPKPAPVVPISRPPNPQTATSHDTMVMTLPYPITHPSNPILINAGMVWPISDVNPPLDPSVGGDTVYHRMALSYYAATNTYAPLGGNVALTGSKVDPNISKAFTASESDPLFVDLTSPLVLVDKNPPLVNKWNALSYIHQSNKSHGDINYSVDYNNPQRACVAYRPQAPGFITLGDFIASINLNAAQSQFQVIQNPVTQNANLMNVGMLPKYMTVPVTWTTAPSTLITFYDLNCPYGYNATKNSCYSSINFNDTSQTMPLCVQYYGGCPSSIAPCNTNMQQNYGCRGSGCTNSFPFGLTAQNVLSYNAQQQPNPFPRASLNGPTTTTSPSTILRTLPVGNAINVPCAIYQQPGNISLLQLAKALNIDPILLWHCNKFADGFIEWFNANSTTVLPVNATDVDYINATLKGPFQVWVPNQYDVSRPMITHPEWQYDPAYYDNLRNPFTVTGV